MRTARGWIAHGNYHERGRDMCHTGARAPGHCSRNGIGCPDVHPDDIERTATAADYAAAVQWAASTPRERARLLGCTCEWEGDRILIVRPTCPAEDQHLLEG